MIYQMAKISTILSVVEGHICGYDWRSTSCIPSASAELLVSTLVPE